MSSSSKQIRGLRHIRTNSDRIDQINKPHKAYMRIGALEMERARALTERRSAVRRIHELDERCQAIDEAKAQLLAAIGEARSQVAPTTDEVAPPPPRRDDEGREPAVERAERSSDVDDEKAPPRARRDHRGFMINY